jgi:drug/metabolite transporter (DMT)-like permease
MAVAGTIAALSAVCTKWALDADAVPAAAAVRLLPSGAAADADAAKEWVVLLWRLAAGAGAAVAMVAMPPRLVAAMLHYGTARALLLSLTVNVILSGLLSAVLLGDSVPGRRWLAGAALMLVGVALVLVVSPPPPPPPTSGPPPGCRAEKSHAD